MERNDQLSSRVHALETQREESSAEATRTREDLVDLRRAVANLTETVSRKERDIEQLKLDGDQMRSWQVHVSAALGIQNPPTPPILECVSRIERLYVAERKVESLTKQARAERAQLLFQMETQKRASLKKERALQKEIYRLKLKTDSSILNDGVQRYWNLSSGLFDDPSSSAKYIKRVMLSAHPDKNADVPHAAKCVQQTLNFLYTALKRKIDHADQS